MRITVVGRGNIGGGLGDRWEKAGHEVTRLGREGGDVSQAEAVLLAVPSPALADALEGLTGLEGRTVIDATNLVGVQPPDGFASNAEFAKSKANGPTASPSTSTSRRCSSGSARPNPGRATCGAATKRPARSSSN